MSFCRSLDHPPERTFEFVVLEFRSEIHLQMFRAITVVTLREDGRDSVDESRIAIRYESDGKGFVVVVGLLGLFECFSEKFEKERPGLRTFARDDCDCERIEFIACIKCSSREKRS